MQIFIKSTTIKKFNFPMIQLNNTEIVEIIGKFDFVSRRKLEFEEPYFVINNIHLIQNIETYKYLNVYFPLNNKNMSLLNDYKDKFYNGEKEFLEYLYEHYEKPIHIQKQLKRVVFNKHIV